MTTPTIHMNGTSAKELVQDLRNAFGAIGIAVEALRQTAPNARDYYTQDGDAFTRARAEYNDRYRRLESVRDELQAIAIAIQQAQRG